MKKDICTLYLIRHGETEWNRNKIIMGNSDAPLTERGVKSSLNLKNTLNSVHFDAAFSSDLGRAIRTAEIVTEGRGIKIVKMAGLRERRYGRFEGMPVSKYIAETAKLFKHINNLSDADHWDFKPEDDVESNSGLLRRFVTDLNQIEKSNIGKTVLISTHGGCIRMLLMWLGYSPYKSLPPGSFENNGYVVLQSNGIDTDVQKVEGLSVFQANTKWG